MCQDSETMTGETPKRPYRMTVRAGHLESTRRRITESAVELHGTLGPSKASFSAVAQHAGVRRSTLYRHFADEEALFAACSAHWLEANPQPDLTSWAAIDNPGLRLRTALQELYAYYEHTEGMLANVIRDEAAMPAVARTLVFFYRYLAEAREILMVGRRVPGKASRSVRAAIGHALSFSTWRSLARQQGLDRSEAIDLMNALVNRGPEAR